MQVDRTTYNKAARYPVGHGYEKRVKAVSSLVIHSTSNPNQKNTDFSAEAKFLYEAPLVSAHYLIGKDGVVVEFLDPAKYMAWHAGNCQKAWDNAVSVGIELHHSVGDPPYPSAQLEALRALCLFLMAQFGITSDLIETHGQIAIAGPYERKTDPSDMTHGGFVAWRETLDLFDAPSEETQDLITPASLLLAPPRATAAQCVKCFLSHPHGEYTAGDVESIVASYFEQCAGIDPLLAVAQMIHETGWLTSPASQRPRRNPAGIGIESSSTPGLSFASWKLASAAHIGRLLAYALPVGQGTDLQQQMIKAALDLRPLRIDFRGTAPTLLGLNGRWATPGLTYAQKIADIANAIRGVRV